MSTLSPYFKSAFIDELTSITTYEHLLGLNWLNATDARQEYFMSSTPREYTYGSGRGVRTYTSNSFTEEISQLLSILNTETASQYDICFLNRYNNQKQHLGWHSDDGKEMDPQHPIAVISFGAEREIWWRDKDFKGVIPQENKRLLTNGSLFVMPSGFQETYQHRIPKADKVVGTRISLTFRKWLKQGED